jgi:hypothetical protein
MVAILEIIKNNNKKTNMEKNFTFVNGEMVDIKTEDKIENNTFVTHMVFTGLDKEEKQATVSFQSKAERDIMFEDYSFDSAMQFADFIRG